MESKTDFLTAVSEACRVNFQDLEYATQDELVHLFILPRLVVKCGEENRGARIGDDFMRFMTKWGRECIERDRFTGELLMELALQRISKGALLHREVDLWEILPEAYREYTANYDQPRLMDDVCLAFLKENLAACFDVENVHYIWHAEEILLGMLDNLHEDGTTEMIWNEEICTTPVSEIYLWAEELAIRRFGVQKLAERYAESYWADGAAFLKKHAAEIDWDGFFKKIDLDAEGYRYGAVKRFFLKIFGRYDDVVKKDLKAVIVCA